MLAASLDASDWVVNGDACIDLAGRGAVEEVAGKRIFTEARVWRWRRCVFTYFMCCLYFCLLDLFWYFSRLFIISFLSFFSSFFFFFSRSLLSLSFSLAAIIMVPRPTERALRPHS